MREILEEVLDLQSHWTSANTAEMERRGIAIRHEIPRWIREREDALASAAGINDFGVEGKDAIGLKSRVPWVRYFSRSESPHATEGWYVVYLFAGDGHAVYVSLNQGTTVPISSSFRPKPADRLRASASWARQQLAEMTAGMPNLVPTIDLRSSLSRHTVSYEHGNVVAFRYARGSVPDDSQLHDDALAMSAFLGEVYRAQSRSPDPGDVEPEVATAFDAMDDAAGKPTRPGRRHGFRPSYAERRAIELRGMEVAARFFEKDGWRVKDVSGSESFDLLITRRGLRHAIEVKATTSLGDQIVVTRKEVREQRQRHPKNGLVVVHSIELERSPDGPVASGGVIEFTTPWDISDDRLEPIAYTYRRR